MSDPYWSINGSELYQGHVLDVLRDSRAESIHMICTSPPYWGLRDYGLPPIEWEPMRYAPMAGLAPLEIVGCDPECRHIWGEEQGKAGKVSHGQGGSTLTGGHDSWGNREGASQGSWCQLCGGWRGCLGLEPTIEMFIGHIVLIWRELWRVLREDGTCWLNLGDSYASSTKSDNRTSEQRSKSSTLGPKRNGLGGDNAAHKAVSFGAHQVKTGLPSKQLLGIPWRVALALQADGWYLRSDIIWAKGVSFCPTYSGSCMPESVRDRPTKGHEYVFLLSKNKRYFYDGDAVREASIDSESLNGRNPRNPYSLGRDDPEGKGRTRVGFANIKAGKTYPKRNLRTVWTINPGSFKGAHFATFPPALVEPMIKAGTSAKGCCPECGAQWERVTKRVQGKPQHTPGGQDEKMFEAKGQHGATSLLYTGGGTQYQTTGWRPTCTHYDNLYYSDFPKPKSDRKWAQRAASGNWFKRARKRAGLAHWPTIPATVVDPFGGSGTTADVARQLGRRWILIELSQTYCDDHIIPRLSEPLLEWAEEQQGREKQPELEAVQMGLL